MTWENVDFGIYLLLRGPRVTQKAHDEHRDGREHRLEPHLGLRDAAVTLLELGEDVIRVAATEDGAENIATTCFSESAFVKRRRQARVARQTHQMRRARGRP